MFEAIIRRVTLEAKRRARARAQALVERARDALPVGVRVEPAEGGISVVGQRLRQRLVLDPAVRALLARLR